MLHLYFLSAWFHDEVSTEDDSSSFSHLWPSDKYCPFPFEAFNTTLLDLCARVQFSLPFCLPSFFRLPGRRWRQVMGRSGSEPLFGPPLCFQAHPQKRKQNLPPGRLQHSWPELWRRPDPDLSVTNRFGHYHNFPLFIFFYNLKEEFRIWRSFISLFTEKILNFSYPQSTKIMIYFNPYHSPLMHPYIQISLK